MANEVFDGAFLAGLECLGTLSLIVYLCPKFGQNANSTPAFEIGIMNRFSDGFMYGLGFWLAGAVISGLGVVISVLFLSGIVSLDLPVHKVAAMPVPQFAPQPQPVATVKNSSMTQADYDERECNQLVLQLAQNNDPAVKKRMYQVCK